MISPDEVLWAFVEVYIRVIYRLGSKGVYPRNRGRMYNIRHVDDSRSMPEEASKLSNAANGTGEVAYMN